MVRFHRGESGSLPIIFRTAFKPLVERLRQSVKQGIRTGELCKVDWIQIILFHLRHNVFLLSQRAHHAARAPHHPFDPGVLKLRRKAAVQFLGNALFTDRAHGATAGKASPQRYADAAVKKLQAGRKHS